MLQFEYVVYTSGTSHFFYIAVSHDPRRYINTSHFFYFAVSHEGILIHPIHNYILLTIDLDPVSKSQNVFDLLLRVLSRIYINASYLYPGERTGHESSTSEVFIFTQYLYPGERAGHESSTSEAFILCVLYSIRVLSRQGFFF